MVAMIKHMKFQENIIVSFLKFCTAKGLIAVKISKELNLDRDGNLRLRW